MEEIRNIFGANGFSRLPVYRESVDTIIGVIHEKDFFHLYLSKQGDLSSIIQPAVYTTEYTKISSLLKNLQSKKIHMAVVLDEYGGTLGIVTLEDILEELVGEIWDEHDEEVNYLKNWMKTPTSWTAKPTCATFSRSSIWKRKTKILTPIPSAAGSSRNTERFPPSDILTNSTGFPWKW